MGTFIIENRQFVVALLLEITTPTTKASFINLESRWIRIIKYTQGNNDKRTKASQLRRKWVQRSPGSTNDFRLQACGCLARGRKPNKECTFPSQTPDICLFLFPIPEISILWTHYYWTFFVDYCLLYLPGSFKIQKRAGNCSQIIVTLDTSKFHMWLDKCMRRSLFRYCQKRYTIR